MKPYVKSNTKKIIEAEKNGDNDGKALWKLMNNDAYVKTMENLRNRIDVKLVSNGKDNLTWTSKPSDIHKEYLPIIWLQYAKVTLTLNKPPYVGMCILD